MPTGHKAPPSPSLPVLSAQFSFPEVCRTLLAEPVSLDSGELAEPKGRTVWYVVAGVPSPLMLFAGVLSEALLSPSLLRRRQDVMRLTAWGA